MRDLHEADTGEVCCVRTCVYIPLYTYVKIAESVSAAFMADEKKIWSMRQFCFIPTMEVVGANSARILTAACGQVGQAMGSIGVCHAYDCRRMCFD